MISEITFVFYTIVKAPNAYLVSYNVLMDVSALAIHV